MAAVLLASAPVVQSAVLWPERSLSQKVAVAVMFALALPTRAELTALATGIVP